MKTSASFSLRSPAQGVTPPAPARSLFTAMHPLHQLSRALGLAAFCVDGGASDGRSPSPLRTSRRALAYAVCVTALLALSASVFFVGMGLVEYPEFAAKSVLANAFTKALHFGTAMAAVGQLSGFRRRHVAGALRRVAAADRVLLAGDASRVYQVTHALLNLQVSLYFVVLTVYFAWDAYVVYQSDELDAVDWLIYAAGQIPHAFNIALSLQFVNLVALLLHRFRRINAQLDALLLRYRAARGSRFWRTLQEELRKCGHDAPSGEFPAAVSGTAPRMRFRKRAPDAARHLRRPRSRTDSLPRRHQPGVGGGGCGGVSEASPFSSLPDSNYSEMDSDYESDDRCECVYDDAGFRRSWTSASNRTSATSIGSDDGVCDVGGDVTDSATRSIGGSGSGDVSSEDAADTEGDYGDDAEKAVGIRGTGDFKTSLSPHSGDSENNNSRPRASGGDDDNDAAHYEAGGTRRTDAERSQEEHRLRGSTASRSDVDLPATVHGASLANRESDETKSRTQDGLSTEKESEGRKGSESTGRFSSQGAALAGTPDNNEVSITSIDKGPESKEEQGENKHDSHSRSKQKEIANPQTSETSLDEQAEDKVGDPPDRNTNLEDIPTTERTEYFGMKRPGNGEGLGERGVESSSSEEGAGTRRKGAGEERGRPARVSCASAPSDESLGTEEEEKGKSSAESGRGERPQVNSARRIRDKGDVTLEDNGKLINKISNVSDTKIAGDRKRDRSPIDQVMKKKDDGRLSFSQPTPSEGSRKKMERIDEVDDVPDSHGKERQQISEEKVETSEKQIAGVKETKKSETKELKKKIKDGEITQDDAGGRDAAEMHPSSIQTSAPCARIRRASTDKRTRSPSASFRSTDAAVSLSVPSVPTRATDPTRTTVITTTTTATTTTSSRTANNNELTLSTYINAGSCRSAPGMNCVHRGVSGSKFPSLIMEPYIATITFNKHLPSNAFRDSSTSLRFPPSTMSTFKPPTPAGTTSAPNLCSELPPPGNSCFPVSPSLNPNLTSTAFHNSHGNLMSTTNLYHSPGRLNASSSVPHLSSFSGSHQGTSVQVNGSTCSRVTYRHVGTSSLPRLNRHPIGIDSPSEASFTPAVKFVTPADATVKESWFDETDSEACGGNCGGATRLRDLRHCHDALSEAARRLAAAFGLPLLLLLAYVFAVTVSCVYHSFISGVQYYAFWLVINTVQAVAVATVCHHCVNAAWRALTLASRALLERPPASVRAELARLRRQVALGPLRFSACGLFAIDVGVLLGMAGGVASYTVIILQFECAH